MAEPVLSSIASLLSIGSALILAINGVNSILDAPEDQRDAEQYLEAMEGLAAYWNLASPLLSGNRGVGGDSGITMINLRFEAIERDLKQLRRAVKPPRRRRTGRFQFSEIQMRFRMLLRQKKISKIKARIEGNLSVMHGFWYVMGMTEQGQHHPHFAGFRAQVQVSGGLDGHHKPVLLFGDAKGAADILRHVFSDLSEHLIHGPESPPAQQPLPEFVDSLWFHDNLCGVLCDTASADNMQPRVINLGKSHHRRRFSRLRDLHRSPMQPLSTARISGSSQVIAGTSSCETVYDIIETRSGTAYITYTALYASYRLGAFEHMATNYRVCFIPRLGPAAPSTGFAIRLHQPLAPSASAVAPTISTFKVRPNNDPLFDALRSWDGVAVDRILSSGEASPNDHDEEGRTPLCHTLGDSRDYDMCKLVLDNGPDITDLDRFGDSGQAIILDPLVSPDSKAGPNPDRLETRLLELLNHHANVLYFPPQPSRRPSRVGSNFFPPIVGDRAVIPLHASRNNGGYPHRRQRVVIRTDIQSQYRRLVQIGVGLETADENGHTSLYFAIKYTPAPTSLSIATQLLDSEADSRSINRFGEGCLHLLLKRFSACGVPVQDTDTKSLILSLLVRLLGPNKQEFQMQGQGHQTLTQRDHDGQTPIDAAMTPTVWPLFCEAMKRAGHDIAHYLVELDRQDGVTSPPTEEIEE